MTAKTSRAFTDVRLLGPLVLACVMFVPWRVEGAGTWSALANTAPGAVETMLLLSDGTVMAQNGGGTTWYSLAPDNTGHYVNGTWTTRSPMSYNRLYYSSAILRDGRVFVAGAEYGNGTTNAEVYNPVNNTWTYIPVPAGLITMNNTVTPNGNNTAGFYDSGCKIIANGNVLIEPVFPASCGSTVLFNPISNTLSPGPAYVRGCYQDEASLVKLPDDSLLTIDPFGTLSERYIPASNTWINDGTIPVSLYDPYGSELGPAILLPNGKAIFFGSLPHTAIYTPSGNTSPGTWMAGPDFPSNQGMPDAPAAMMFNGKILVASTPTPLNSNHFPTPTSFYEYDYSAGATGTFTRVNSPTGGLTDSQVAYSTRMLCLPDGTVLYTRATSQLYVYTPDGSPLTAGKPTISSITQNPDGSYHLTGTMLNGISEGAAYGDDAQMDSNYPLVRMTNSVSGNVYYARTYNWSSTSVMTGNNPVTTEFTPPAILPAGSYSLVVVANGIGSDPVTWSGPPVLHFASATLTGGNGDQSVDPGECNDLTVIVRNDGTSTATNISATLTTTTPGVAVVQANSTYPNIASGAAAANMAAFSISTSPSFVCGTPVSLALVLNSSGGSTTVPFNLGSAEAGYAITQSTGASIVPGTTDVGLHCLDCTTTISLPFNYSFYGQSFSTADVSTKGNIQFASSGFQYVNSCLPTSAFGPTILAFWDDLRTDASGSGIFTSTSGSAPNRIFNIEWRATYCNGGLPLNFEVRLYEGQSRFDLIYGNLNGTGSSATVGVQKDTGAFTQFECNSGGLSPGLQLTFQQGCTGAGVIYVDRSYQGIVINGSICAPFKTVTTGYQAAQNNNTIRIFSGNYNEAILMNKTLLLQATNDVVNIGIP